MYAVAVCEDRQETRTEILSLCDAILTELAVEHRVSPFSSAEALEAALRSGERFDLLCLDILMEGESGMELARRLRETDERTSILFLTGSSEFLKDGYEVRPLQYLLKPIDRGELMRAIETDLRLHHRPRTVTLRVGARTLVLPLEDIRYVESRDHGSVFHMNGDERFLPLSLGETESLLPRECFCRCHNSFLVNMRHIRGLGGRTLYLTDGELSIGRKYAADFQERFVRYLNEQ